MGLIDLARGSGGGNWMKIYKAILNRPKRSAKNESYCEKSSENTNGNSLESALDLEEQIRRRAYDLYERRGREAGHETEDWLQAEAELASERPQSLEGEVVKTNRKPLVTKTGKSKAKQAKQAEIITAN
jgi:hypothetical protein